MIPSPPPESEAGGSAPPRPLVLDTNVALDWLAFEDPRTRALAAAVQSGAWHCVGTLAMREELADVLSRPAFARFDRAAVLAAWDAQVTVRAAPARGPLACSDPDDQAFIDLALSLSGAWLLSRDRALLVLARAAAAHGVTVRDLDDLDLPPR